jgi:hypothetical protein
MEPVWVDNMCFAVVARRGVEAAGSAAVSSPHRRVSLHQLVRWVWLRVRWGDLLVRAVRVDPVAAAMSFA